jgi:hypothetical protein
MSNCWICGRPADSGEHKIKKSDLVRIFGKPSEISGQGLLYKSQSEIFVRMQGPSSKHVKYDGVICKKCNNERTKSCDEAYDAFIQYMEEHKDVILNRRQICFSEIYGNNWESSQLELFRYFTKSFGCRIADAARDVPIDMVEIMRNPTFQTALWVCIAVNEDTLADKEFGHLRAGIGNLVSNEGEIVFHKYTSANFYKWLVFSFWYGWGPFGPVGECWCADREFLRLGSYRKSESMVSIAREDGSIITWSGLES